ncbi:MAG TPA: glycosyltransferase [Vicinamibacterales bacterium]|nr:glycosyltransferase [Vicinamibacterales bacterium]
MTNDRRPDVSIIIPTRARPASLLRALGALERQDFAAARLEVVVVDDGEGEALRGLGHGQPRPYSVRALPNQGRGAAAARNTGARSALSPLLVFLDDDIEAAPGLVSAHVRAHRAGATVTIGYLPARPTGAGRFFAFTLRNWWEEMFAAMRRPGHRYSFRDLLTGNCAVGAELFERAGGFDQALACHEDYELGVRLVEAGARLAFVEDAEGVHHEMTTVERSLERKRAEGRADVQIVRKHPALVARLPLAAPRPRRQRALRRLVFQHPVAARSLLRALRSSLDLFEAARMRGRWGVRLHEMLDLAYWQGVASEVQTLEGFDALVQDACVSPLQAGWWLRADLEEGIEAVAARVDAVRPDGVALTYGGERVGAIPPSPASERLRGVHVESALAHDLARPLLLALARRGAVGVEERGGRLLPTAPLPREPFPMRRSWRTSPCSAPCATGAGRPLSGCTGTASSP